MGIKRDDIGVRIAADATKLMALAPFRTDQLALLRALRHSSRTSSCEGLIVELFSAKAQAGRKIEGTDHVLQPDPTL